MFSLKAFDLSSPNYPDFIPNIVWSTLEMKVMRDIEDFILSTEFGGE